MTRFPWTALLYRLSETDSGTRLTRPRLVPAMDAGEPAALKRIPGDALTFAGAADSAADGVTMTCVCSAAPSGITVAATVTSDTLWRGVQVILPLELAPNWRSYVIAPGAMYNENRFLLSPPPYCPYLLTEGITPDGPSVQVDVPRLTADTGLCAYRRLNAAL